VSVRGTASDGDLVTNPPSWTLRKVTKSKKSKNSTKQPHAIDSIDGTIARYFGRKPCLKRSVNKVARSSKVVTAKSKGRLSSIPIADLNI
jgi:hypothetical protein